VSATTTTPPHRPHPPPVPYPTLFRSQTTSAAITVTVSNDTTAPVISAVAASGVTASAATIGWTTNEASDSQVDYGPTTAYGSSTAHKPTPVLRQSATVGCRSGRKIYH